MILSGRYNPQFKQMFSISHTPDAVEPVASREPLSLRRIEYAERLRRLMRHDGAH
jgi:hypothetical protein